MIRQALLTLLLVMAVAGSANAQVTNLKVITDATPDYSDMESLVHSITSRWETPKEKMWALFYWNHIARRQTSPMAIRGFDLTDPVMQYNDYGYTMCCTISGINTSVWSYMGYPVRYWEIGHHTVSEVFYDDKWHFYDNSLSVHYTLCDGVTVAGVEDVGAERGCELSGGKVEQGHIAKYHCVDSTSIKGYIAGSDTLRSLDKMAASLHPDNLKHQYFYKHATWGHRYILNLRNGETYTRKYWKEPDKDNSPEYYVQRNGKSKDLETAQPRFRIRSNGFRTFTPELVSSNLPGVIHSQKNMRAVEPFGLEPASATVPGEVIFNVEGGNVIASMTIKPTLQKSSAQDVAKIYLSTSNGLKWDEVWSAGDATGEIKPSIPLIQEVSGAYDVLVKVELTGQASDAAPRLKNISFESITQLNSKTQPRLNIGKNTVYVGAGAPTESIVLVPDLREGRDEHYIHKKDNIAQVPRQDGRYATLYIDDAAVPKGYVIFKVDAPDDITNITYGGRFCVRAPKSHIDLLHSFDDGKTWIQSYSVADNSPPWDTVHYSTVSDVPAGTRSVLFKYHLFSFEGAPSLCGIFNVRMEVNHKVADPGFKPAEVQFTWKERQEDYSLVERSHTQLVESVPFTYSINVGGADHPVMESLKINLKSANNNGSIKYGYSDGKDAGGEKWTGNWVTYGKNFAENKPYTVSVPSETNEKGAGDPEGKRLTDGRVSGAYSFLGSPYEMAALYPAESQPVITVDLGEPKQASAFRIHLHGEPKQDAIKGEVKDKVEVLTSLDGKTFTSAGFFNFKLRWKDIPVNYMWNDEETFKAHNFLLVPEKPVQARYVQYKITPSRKVAVTEVQVLESVKLEPFDLKLAMPNDQQTARAN
jgi:hypothetical protein